MAQARAKAQKPLISADFKITVTGNTAQFSGDFPVEVVRGATSYYTEGYRFSPAYRRKVWDGKVHLFNVRSSSLPAGLITTVVNAVRALDANAQITIEDQRQSTDPVPVGVKDAFNLHGIEFGVGKFDYQIKAVQAALAGKRGILKLAVNSGKCLAPDTLVMLYNGSLVRADSVVVGDRLMGPDSTPRTVHSTGSGIDVMYKITPKRGGTSFVCNSAHVLTLFDTTQNKVVDVPVSEFLSWGKFRKSESRLIRAAVDFPDTQPAPSVDPWLLGLWYADGRKSLSFVEITKPDTEIANALQLAATSLGMQLNCYRGKDPTRCPQWRLVTPAGKPNPLLTGIRAAYGDGAKLPENYIKGSRSVRQEFLAGLIDGDGYSEGSYVEIIQKHKQWAEDIAFLARSLGFKVSIREKLVRLPQWDVPRSYWRVCLTGDTAELPLRLQRKHARCEKNSLRTGFRVERIGEGSYAGFTLDNDGRFLLGDFTVTHNTECACAITKYYGLPTVFIVPGIDLLHQTRARFAARLNVPIEEIGMIGDGHVTPGILVTVATIDTLHSKQDDPMVHTFLTDIWKVAFIDECHGASADTGFEVLDTLTAPYRYGLSGTPLDRSDGADLRLIAQTGEVLYDVSNRELIARGVSSHARIEIKRITGPKVTGTHYKTVHKQAVIDNNTLNDDITQWVPEQVKAGKQVVILVTEIEHGEKLERHLRAVSHSVKFISGKEESQVRINTLKDFNSGKLRCMIGTSILYQGIDTPNIDVLVFADLGKSKIRVLQAIGRGLRKREGKDHLVVRDYANFCHKWFIKHSLRRLQLYRNEKCFDITVAP